MTTLIRFFPELSNLAHYKSIGKKESKIRLLEESVALIP